MFVMAEGSSYVKSVTNCRSCSRKIIRSSCSEDNYCDDCEDMVKEIVQLQDSNKEYFKEKKIDALSGLVRTSSCLLEKVTFLSLSLVMPIPSIFIIYGLQPSWRQGLPML